MATRKELVETYEQLLHIQLSDGNWDADPYMHGMANGMILFHQIAKQPTGDPEFKSAPDYWKAKIPRTIQKTKIFFEYIWLHFKWALSSIISIMTGLTFEFKPGSWMKVSYASE